MRTLYLNKKKVAKKSTMGSPYKMEVIDSEVEDFKKKLSYGDALNELFVKIHMSYPSRKDPLRKSWTNLQFRPHE